MKIPFRFLEYHTSDWKDFPLSEKMQNVSQQHLKQIKPLDSKAAESLHDYISHIQSGTNSLLNPVRFKYTRNIAITDNNHEKIQIWLKEIDLKLYEPVYLYWQTGIAVIIPFGIFIEYFSIFYHQPFGNLTIIDATMDWMLIAVAHGEIFYSSNSEIPSLSAMDEPDPTSVKGTFRNLIDKISDLIFPE